MLQRSFDHNFSKQHADDYLWLFLVLFLLCSCSANGQSGTHSTNDVQYPRLHTPPKDTTAPSAYSNNRPHVRFYRDKNHVYDDDMDIKKGVDPASFKVLSYELVRDKNHIYRIEYPKEFKKIEQIDAASFKFIGGNNFGGAQFMKDKNHVYFFNNDTAKVIENADPATFKHIWTEKETDARVYADKNHLFDHEAQIVASFSASPEKTVFKEKEDYIYESGYANMKKIGIRKDEIKHLKHGIFTDGVEVFSLNWLDVFENADPKTFKILNKIYAKDNNTVYHYADIEKRLDADTFEMLGKKDSSLYMRDKNGIYWEDVEKELESVDPETFEVVSKHYAKDKNNVYVHSSILEHADPETFRVRRDTTGKPAVAVDKNHIYFGNEIVEELKPDKIKTVVGVDSWLDNKHWHGLVYDEHKRSYRFLQCNRIKASNLPAEEYYILEGKVYYTSNSDSFCEGDLIEEADPETFIALNEEYAKDKNYVYHEGEPISEMVYLNKNRQWETSNKKAYKIAQELHGTDPTEDEVLEFVTAYFKRPKSLLKEDPFNIRFGRKKIKAMGGKRTKTIRLNPATVQMFSGSDGKDDKYYFRNESISIYRYYRYPNVDFETLQNIAPKWGPVKDKNHVYNSDFEIIKGVDPQTIEPVYDNR